MAPALPNPCISSQLRQLIYYHIDNNLLSNALFLAERLVAHESKPSSGKPNDSNVSRYEATYLLALCHMRLGDNATAYEVSLKAAKAHLGCSYIFAQACLALDKHRDGIVALEKTRGYWGGQNSFGKHTQTSRCLEPDASAVSCLLGKLYLGYDDKVKASNHFEEALKLNPFMWDAFTKLCDMGANMLVSNIFKMNPEMEALMKVNRDPEGQYGKDSSGSTFDQPPARARPVPVATDGPDPFNSFNNTSSRGFGGGLFGLGGAPSQRSNESNLGLTSMPTPAGSFAPDWETPTGPGAVDITNAQSRREASAHPDDPPQAPSRQRRTMQGLGMDFSMDVPKMGRSGMTIKRQQRPVDVIEDPPPRYNSNGVPSTVTDRKRTASGQAPSRATSEDPGAPQRRSARLLNHIRPTRPTSNVASIGPPVGRELKKAKPPISKIMRPIGGGSTAGRQVSGNRMPVEDAMDVDQKESSSRSRPAASRSNTILRSLVNSDSTDPSGALRVILGLFMKLGNGYFALSKYKCSEAIEHYSLLPKEQRDTPWVMAQMGRAYYEQSSYEEAEVYFKRIRQMSPTRFEDMELYSTILWFLKRETELAFLAHELIDSPSGWLSPHAWCALGNSWSLQRDHEQALRCFKRAAQLNPRFAYAYTLQGHEQIENEEYDKAMTCYREAMAVDKRHYHAYYGVGRVFEKQGNNKKAFLHFKAASEINQTNPVLICWLGTILEKQGEKREALTFYQRAVELSPKSEQFRYKKARVLMSLQRMDESLTELLILKDMTPNFAMVHYLLGELYKAQREKGLAVKHFTTALNLDPKASQRIKEAMESLEVDDDAQSGGMRMHT